MSSFSSTSGSTPLRRRRTPSRPDSELGGRRPVARRSTPSALRRLGRWGGPHNMSPFPERGGAEIRVPHCPAAAGKNRPPLPRRGRDKPTSPPPPRQGQTDLPSPAAAGEGGGGGVPPSSTPTGDRWGEGAARCLAAPVGGGRERGDAVISPRIFPRPVTGLLGAIAVLALAACQGPAPAAPGGAQSGQNPLCHLLNACGQPPVALGPKAVPMAGAVEATG